MSSLDKPPPPPLSVRTPHKFRKLRRFFAKKCGRLHLKNPHCPHWTTPLTADVFYGRPPNEDLRFMLQIISTLKAIKTDTSSVEVWYVDSGGMNHHYFVAPASANQHIIIEFKSEEKISKILVKTGTPVRSNK